MPTQWTWRPDVLTNAAEEQLASVRDGVLTTAAGERLALESSLDSSSPRFFLRAQTAAGEDFSVSQAGITITRLRAACGEREYLLERRNPFRRERRIVARRSGAEVASTAPAGNGLQVSVGELPELDAIFLSYACALLDATPRVLRT